MQKYCRKMKKRRVNFSLLRANEVGNTEALLSILWASVVKICTFGCRPLACGRVSTGQCTCFHRPVETRPQASGRQLIIEKRMALHLWLNLLLPFLSSLFIR